MKDREIRKSLRKGLDDAKKYYLQGLKDRWTTEEAEDRRIIALTLWEILETLDAIERKL